MVSAVITALVVIAGVWLVWSVIRYFLERRA